MTRSPLRRWWNCWLFHSWDRSRVVDGYSKWHDGFRPARFHPCRFCPATWEIPGGYFS